MFCEKCGGELFKTKKILKCPKCGAEYGLDYTVDLPESNENSGAAGGITVKRFSSKNNIILIVLTAVLALGIGGTAVGIGISNMPANRVSRYMGAAERYLSEMNYEQAIIEFQRILEIEPMNVDAYLGLANAYIGLGDGDKAIEVLKRGLELTGDERIKAMLDNLTEPEPESLMLSWADVDGNIINLDFGHFAKRDGELWHFCDESGKFVSDKKYKYIKNFVGTSGANFSLVTTEDGRVFSIDRNYKELFELENPDKYAISNQDDPLILSWHIKEWNNDNDKDYLHIYAPDGKELYNWNQNECIDGCGKLASLDDPMIPDEAKSYDCDCKYHFDVQCSSISNQLQQYNTVSVTESKIYVSFQYELIFDWDHAKEEAAIQAEREERIKNGETWWFEATGTYLHNKFAHITYELSLENGKLNLKGNELVLESGKGSIMGKSVITEGDDYIIVNNINPTPDTYYSLLASDTNRGFVSKYDYSNEYELSNVNFNYVYSFVDDKLMICAKFIDDTQKAAQFALFETNWQDNAELDIKFDDDILNGGHKRISDFYDVIGYTDNDIKLGYILVSRSEKWGYISIGTGEELAMFDDATNFSNGYAVVTTNGIGHLIDSNFNAILDDFPCEGASSLGDGSFIIRNGEDVKRLVIEN